MSVGKEITGVWNNLKELDLRPIREAAESELRLAIVGRPGVGRHTLAAALQDDPLHPALQTGAPVMIATLDEPAQAASASLVILMVPVNASSVEAEQRFIQAWLKQHKPLVVFYNKLDLLPPKGGIIPWLETGPARAIYGSALSKDFLMGEFSSAVMNALPNHLLALARRYPLFRGQVAEKLIQETCMANATYSISTGLAEMIPVLNIPLNVADMFVLTKAQAMLVYKLGLALGFSTDWQFYVAEFGGVVGSGFLWRQLARSLIGLIPVYGLIPKVAVAYSGTYVVGRVVLSWYLSGRHLPRKELAALSRQAFASGKELAKKLAAKAPRPKLPRPRLALPGRKSKPEAMVIDASAEPGSPENG